ncbi:MAG: LmeA family phospholipid-binding protein [Anaerolineae bacterium]|nr:LmeA family phospholipid-binding protein [Anaerolineae bacterium]NIN95271.1 LmeA family phospholipid-binding protein [Anaerolineae bacterium]NIQ78236.1 LmeA family phospholipid-binding protein [Anaerolineae bacterium]
MSNHMHLHKLHPGLTILVALALLALACLPCQGSSQLIPTPVRTVPVSTEEAEKLISILGRQLPLDDEGCFVLTITEEELTSFVALSMQESIVDPQILLTGGKMHLHGTLVDPIDAPITAAVSVQPESGRVQLTVETVALDGFPVPETFIDAFVQQIEDSITLAQRHENMEVNEVDITEGELIVRGCATS